MNKRNCVSILVLVSALFCSNVYAADFYAEVVSVTGRADYMKNDQWTAAKAGDKLSKGTVIQTGFKSELVLKIQDSVVNVAPLTRMTIELLKSQDEKDSSSIYVATGSVSSEVNRANNRKVGFTVRSPVATASVRGTKFGVRNVFRSTTVDTGLGSVETWPTDFAAPRIDYSDSKASGVLFRDKNGNESDKLDSYEAPGKGSTLVSKNQSIGYSDNGNISYSLGNAQDSSGTLSSVDKESKKEAVNAVPFAGTSGIQLVSSGIIPEQTSGALLGEAENSTVTISVTFPE